MNKPKFAWWPFRSLALAVPVLAASLTFGCCASQNAPLHAMPLFFCLLGAGNGYLIGIALGDLGRSMIAIPLGALAGYFLSFVLVADFSPEYFWFWVLCIVLYPLLLASITAAMPLRLSAFDVYSAACAGFYSGLQGLFAGLALATALYSALVFLTRPLTTFQFAASLAVGIAVTNVCAVGKLLRLGHRASPPLPEHPPDVPAEVFANSPKGKTVSF
jgi:hypothetical protein